LYLRTGMYCKQTFYRDSDPSAKPDLWRNLLNRAKVSILGTPRQFMDKFWMILLPLYFIPALLSIRKRNAGRIFVLNSFLGWTVIGWFIALFWALAPEHSTYAVPLKADLPPCSSRRCHICSKYSNPDAAVCVFCGTILIPPVLLHDGSSKPTKKTCSVIPETLETKKIA